MFKLVLTLSAIYLAVIGLALMFAPRQFGIGAVPPDGQRYVRSHAELDVTFSYRATRSLTLIGAVKNLLDRTPPFSATNATNGGFTQQGFAELYTARGRFLQAGVEFSF